MDNLPTHLPNNKKHRVPEKKPIANLKVEKEETQSKQVVPVLGTNIVLQTPEDIENWIKERKRNYPTNKRIQEKEQQQKISKPSNNNNVNNNRKFPSSVSRESITPSSLPSNNKNNNTEGYVKNVLGIKTFIPYRFKPTLANERKKFASRLLSTEQHHSNLAIVEFVADLVSQGLVGSKEAN